MSTRKKARQAPDVDALMQRLWPIHGPYSHELVLTAAETATELVRYINNATLNDPDGTLPHPEVSGKLAGYLQQVVSGLRQTVDQLLPPETLWTRKGAITATGSAPPRDVLNGAIQHLRAANDDLSTLASELGRAQSLLNRLAIEPAKED